MVEMIEGLRVGQAPGAVVKDGGQSTVDCGKYTSESEKSQMEVKMFDEIDDERGIDPYEPITEEDEGFPVWLPIILYPLIAISWVINLFVREEAR